MAKEINSREDIEKMVDLFYEELLKDQVIASFFTNTNWEHHKKVMSDFWENIIFYSGTFGGNPMAKHLELKKRIPFNKQHFKKWLQVFERVINKNFTGKNAEIAIIKAKEIGKIMVSFLVK